MVMVVMMVMAAIPRHDHHSTIASIVAVVMVMMMVVIVLRQADIAFRRRVGLRFIDSFQQLRGVRNRLKQFGKGIRRQ